MCIRLWESDADLTPFVASIIKRGITMDSKEFNTKVLGDKISWFDRVGLHRLSTENTAKIILSTRERDGNFVGYKVTIINRVNGVIEGKFFNLNDYILPKIEDNPRNEISAYHVEYYILLKHDKLKFNIEPEDTKPLFEAIFKYIAFFR